MSQKKHKKDDNVLTHVTRWTMGKSSKKGTPFVKVYFDGGITWTGYLTPATHESTMKTLGIMGFKGKNLGELAKEGALDMQRDLIAVIEESFEYRGKTYYNARFINALKGFDYGNIDQSIINEFSSYSTNGFIDTETNSKRDAPASGSMQSNYKPKTDVSFTADDIPF